MRVRTFSADTADEALKRVHEAWGDAAKILSTYESPRGRGAEVRATLADDAANHAVDHETDNVTPLNPIDADLERRLRAEIAASAVKPQRDRLTEALNRHQTPKPIVKKIVDQAERARLQDDILALGSAFDGWGLFDPIPVKTNAELLFFGLDEEAVLATMDAFEAQGRLHRSETRFDKAALDNWTSQQIVPLATRVKNQKLEPVLVLPFDTSQTQIKQSVEILAAMGGHRLVMTNVGETRVLGGLISAGCHPRARLAQVLLTEEHGRRLEVLNPLSLARLALFW
ncbi:MAG: hypothetical protein EP347_02950 [Alphaproteobacteria bacterium]|nr:MAG: hypothetical protein EP347_02950 [Alphaproteobacteria bacterium]